MKTNERIKKIKCQRVELKAMIEHIFIDEKILPTPSTKEGFYAMSVAKRKRQEACMWMGVALQAHSDSTPYTEADNPENAIVHPEVDVIKTEELNK